MQPSLSTVRHHSMNNSLEEELDTQVGLLSDTITKSTTRVSSHWRAQRLHIAHAVFTVLLLFTLLVTLLPAKQRHKSLQPFGNCGGSPAEAQKLGCQFDPMSFSWLPSACYDAELVTQFLALRDWTWSLDRKRQATVSREEVLTGELTDLYVSREYHIFHCTFQWRKMHRGIQRGVIDTYIGNYEHTSHCERMITDDVPRNLTDTKIRMKFPRCQFVWGLETTMPSFETLI